MTAPAAAAQRAGLHESSFTNLSRLTAAGLQGV
jgi:hypothetical protein